MEKLETRVYGKSIEIGFQPGFVGQMMQFDNIFGTISPPIVELN